MARNRRHMSEHPAMATAQRKIKDIRANEARTPKVVAAAKPRSLAQKNALTSSAIKNSVGLQAHRLIIDGVTIKQVDAMASRFNVIDRGQVLEVIGVSERTLQRKAQTSSTLLDTNASDRAIRLSSVTDLAVEVLGSMENAEQWLTSPELSLDGARPIDLLQSTPGTEAVRTLLMRMDFGVYA
jgi:putative toxin-antitoxin system antitoxin component (TIGR02293 family)